jgi:hypothetical protein
LFTEAVPKFQFLEQLLIKTTKACDKTTDFGTSSTVKITFGVPEGNILYHTRKQSEIIGNFTGFGPGSQYVAEYASEVFMAGVGEETPGIGEHPDKT